MGGQYQMKGLIYETYHYAQPVIVTIQDMNLDGVNEIMAIAGDDRFRNVFLIQWGGSEFQMLNLDPVLGFSACSELYGPSWAYALDTDDNGTLELVLKQTIPIWSEYTDGLPWRKETRTCTWNGVSYVLTRTEIDTPPEYRFQAIQDGDRATLAGDYARALDLYQQAIFSDKLDWWSHDRRRYEVDAGGYKPTPIPSLSPDPAEYPMLAAYARYRIMLLHTVRGYLSDAEIVYKTLQDKFPQGQVGHAYAEMATAFWDEFRLSKNLEQACAKAVEYATLHPVDVLSYLGNSEYSTPYFGDQSLKYTPEDVCPFR